jgi:hypothetical protein
MKTFEQLTTMQREDMISMAHYELMEHIASGVIEVTLVNPESQKRFETILRKGRESRRLIQLYLLADKPIRDELYRLAIVAASGSQYTDAGDPVTKVSKDDVDQYFAWEPQGRTGTASHSH